MSAIEIYTYESATICKETTLTQRSRPTQPNPDYGNDGGPAFGANRLRGDAHCGRSGNVAERRCSAALGRRHLPGVRRRSRGRGQSAWSSSSWPPTSFAAFATHTGGEHMHSNRTPRTLHRALHFVAQAGAKTTISPFGSDRAPPPLRPPFHEVLLARANPGEPPAPPTPDPHERPFEGLSYSCIRPLAH